MGMDSLDLLHTHGIENEMKLIMKDYEEANPCMREEQEDAGF
jgi:hypothetical protein